MTDDAIRRTGQCLCGDVRFEATIAAMDMGACYCSMCRRWTGGVFLAVQCTGIKIADPDALAVYASSERASAVFAGHAAAACSGDQRMARIWPCRSKALTSPAISR